MEKMPVGKYALLDTIMQIFKGLDNVITIFWWGIEQIRKRKKKENDSWLKVISQQFKTKYEESLNVLVWYEETYLILEGKK